MLYPVLRDMVSRMFVVGFGESILGVPFGELPVQSMGQRGCTGKP